MGELLASGQDPVGPRKAGQEIVPKVKFVGVALHETEGVVSAGSLAPAPPPASPSKGC